MTSLACHASSIVILNDPVISLSKRSFPSIWSSHSVLRWNAKERNSRSHRVARFPRQLQQQPNLPLGAAGPRGPTASRALWESGPRRRRRQVRATLQSLCLALCVSIHTFINHPTFKEKQKRSESFHRAVTIQTRRRSWGHYPARRARRDTSSCESAGESRWKFLRSDTCSPLK